MAENSNDFTLERFAVTKPRRKRPRPVAPVKKKTKIYIYIYIFNNLPYCKLIIQVDLYDAKLLASFCYVEQINPCTLPLFFA